MFVAQCLEGSSTKMANHVLLFVAVLLGLCLSTCFSTADQEETLKAQLISVFEKESDVGSDGGDIICQLCKDVTFILQEEISLANLTIEVAMKVSKMICDALTNKTKVGMMRMALQTKKSSMSKKFTHLHKLNCIAYVWTL